MRRPLALVAMFYAAGLLLAGIAQPPLALLFSASLALVALALLSQKLRPALVLPVVVLAGWTNLASRTAVVSPNDLRTLLGDSAAEVTLRGRLADTPSERVYMQDEEESFRTLALVNVSALRHGTNWQSAYGRVVVITPGKLPEAFFAEQTVQISGVIAPPAAPLAEGLFDYRTFLKRHGIYFQLKAESPGNWFLLSTNSRHPISDRFLAWAKATISRGLPVEDKPLRLLCAMTLGSQNLLPSETYEPFIESGTMHIFAISGLHIALIAGILVSLLRVLQVSRAWCGLIVIPLIWFYTAATGWQPSAIRSTIMMSIIIGGWALKRPSDMLNSLAAAALVILVWDPQQLFQASFQLSFLVVLSIGLFLPPLERLRDRWLRPDPLLPPELVPRWKQWLGSPLRFVTTCLAVSLAAWLGSWPLTAYYFHLFSPITLLANLLIVPLSSAALACNMGSLLCGAWFPGATELFNHSAWFWMLLMTKISEYAVRTPGAFFFVPAPAIADFVIYYPALFAVLSGFAFARARRIWTAVAAVCIAIFYFGRWHAVLETTEITVLPLNGGHAVYVDAPGRSRDLLVDCGNTNSVEFVMKPFLRAQGVNRLQHLVLTHGDMRHIGGLELLEDSVPVQQFVTSTVRFRSPVYRRTIEALERNPEHWRVVTSGDEIVEWNILHPSREDRFSQADDNAIVLRADLNGLRILLLSDLGRPGQNVLLERGHDLKADIVVAGLPEQGEPASEALLDAVRPQLVIIVDSEFPATKRASAVLHERLASRRIPVIYTRSSGAVTITAQPKRWSVRAMNGYQCGSDAVSRQ